MANSVGLAEASAATTPVRAPPAEPTVTAPPPTLVARAVLTAVTPVLGGHRLAFVTVANLACGERRFVELTRTL